MRMLDRKVLRDAVHLRGQLLAVAAMVTCGVAVFIMLRSMHGYLRDSQAAYYDAYAFPDLFAHVDRAPSAVAKDLAAVPGVGAVYTRIVRDVVLDVPGLPEPATGHLVSLPDGETPPLNRLHLRSGRLPDPRRRDEVVLSAAFAGANGLRPGDSLGAVLNGRWQRLTVVGTAISPEFIYEVSSWGAVFPDNRRFGAIWMGRSALEAALEMEGGFNDVVATLDGRASERAVIDAFDERLGRHGGLGAYGRDQHMSHEFVSSEIQETQITATFFPAVFMIVTAFLLHTTLIRLVRIEREQIGLLKAFGMPPRAIALHYLEIGSLPVSVGIAAGTGLGIWLAGRMAAVYARFYQFPDVAFHLDWRVVSTAAGIAILTAVVGALTAARSVFRLAPAVAMAPPAPIRFRHGALERTRVWRSLSPATRLIARNLARARWKSATTVIGLGLTLGVVGAVMSMFDAVDYIADLQFNHATREDVAVYFDTPRAPGALGQMAHLPGVLAVEGIRVAPATLVRGHREEGVALVGLRADDELRRIVDARFVVHHAPPSGLLVSRMLAKQLEVRPGETVRVEVLEGSRPVREVEVMGLVDELIGVEVYMEAEALRRLLGEGPTVSGARLRVDPRRMEELNAALKSMPGVASVVVKETVVESFRATIEESFTIALTTTLLLSAVLVMAIVYNQSRIALSERGRDLASLRVLGFSRREVARMLVGEQAVLVLLSIPLGLVLAWLLTTLIMLRFESELFRLPVVVDAATYLQGVALILGASAVAAWLVRRRLDRFDLVSVLKTRE